MVQLRLNVSFFKSVLGDSTSPVGSPESHLQAGLLIAGREETIGVQFPGGALDAQEGDFTVETLDPTIDASLLPEGTDFFVTRGGKMIGRGSVCKL